MNTDWRGGGGQSAKLQGVATLESNCSGQGKLEQTPCLWPRIKFGRKCSDFSWTLFFMKNNRNSYEMKAIPGGYGEECALSKVFYLDIELTG